MSNEIQSSTAARRKQRHERARAHIRAHAALSEDERAAASATTYRAFIRQLAHDHAMHRARQMAKILFGAKQ